VTKAKQGSLLGVFVLAILTKRATALGAFYGLITGMIVVLIVAFTTPIAFLWHNLIGTVVVVATGMAISIPGVTVRSVWGSPDLIPKWFYARADVEGAPSVFLFRLDRQSFDGRGRFCFF